MRPAKDINDAAYKNYMSQLNEIKDRHNTYMTYLIGADMIEEAYKHLGIMMAYKTIDKESCLISGNSGNKALDKLVKGKDRFRRDYRNSTDFIPDWIFGEIEDKASTEVTRLAYWEDNMTDKDDIPRKYRVNKGKEEIDIVNLWNKRWVDRAYNDIEKIAAGDSKDTMKWIEFEYRKCLDGVDRIIKVCNRDAVIGYVIISVDKGYKANIIMNYNEVLKRRIEVDELLSKICTQIGGMIKIGEDNKTLNCFECIVCKDTAVKRQGQEIARTNIIDEIKLGGSIVDIIT